MDDSWINPNECMKLRITKKRKLSNDIIVSNNVNNSSSFSNELLSDQSSNDVKKTRNPFMKSTFNISKNTRNVEKNERNLLIRRSASLSNIEATSEDSNSGFLIQMLNSHFPVRNINVFYI